MLALVIDKRQRDLGGFEVGRVLPFAKRRMVGPFIFFDHMGPVDLPKGLPVAADVRPHPHIGLSTVTYLFAGEIMHRDSVGSQQAIRPHEVNWMTAGRGITHSERFEKARAAGGPMHAIQSWVALPADREECAPSFRHHGAADLPVVEDGGVWARVLAGTAFGQTAGVEIASPLFYAHVVLTSGASVQLPSDYPERAAYVVSGDVEHEGRAFQAGQMVVFEPVQPALFRATTPSVIMLLGGEPVGERFIDWNFVSSSKARIAQAREDWSAGRLKLPDFDNREFIPLPDAAVRKPNSMS
jgi:redox-sensitive bicupin YhaK (pirin superfamily)